MLLPNLNPYRGLCNGTRLIVMHVVQGGRVCSASTNHWRFVSGQHRSYSTYRFTTQGWRVPIRVASTSVPGACLLRNDYQQVPRTNSRAGRHLPCRRGVCTLTVIFCCAACLPSRSHSVRLHCSASRDARGPRTLCTKKS